MFSNKDQCMGNTIVLSPLAPDPIRVQSCVGVNSEPIDIV